MRKLFRDLRGNTLMIAAIAIPVVIGCAGLAVDTIQWTLWKRQLQRAADSAAIAGVYDRGSASGSTSNTVSAVSHDLTVNLHTPMALEAGYPVVSFPPDAQFETNQVSVTLAIQQALPFSSLFMTTPPVILARATAASISAGGSACVEALETSANLTGISNIGTTTVSAPNCIIYSNSPSTNSASAGGNSNVVAKAIAAVGGIQQSANWNVQKYIPYSPPLPDPFANVTPNQSDMHCMGAALSDSTDFTTLGTTNCFSSLSVKPNRTLNVPANFGPIYIDAGSVSLQGTFNCSGCTIVLTNSSPAPGATIGTFSTNSQANNNITAPTSGPFKGLAVYQDRRATGNMDKMNGGSSSVITGALYFPSDELRINGGGSSTSLCAMIVARRIVFTGNSGISISNPDDSSCAGSGLPSSGSVRAVRLVA